MTLPRISRRIAAIAESATLKVDAKAKALQAEGRPVISYAAGEPDFATPGNIVDAASRAVLDPKNYKYTPAAGLPDLREAIAQKTLRDSGLEVAPSQVIVTNGGKQAVYQAFATLLDDGDEVVGRVNIHEIVRGPSMRGVIGYFVDGAVAGRGLASAAVDEAVRIAFGRLGLHRIEAGVKVGNDASARVLERNGFTRFGVARDYLKLAGRWHDHVLYEKIAP